MTAPYATARWPAAAATAAIWALAAASVVFWGLRWTAPPDAVVPPAATRLRAEPDPAAVARALGSASNQPVAAVAVPEAASRFALLGVVADADRQGAALIAVDGRPARPFKVGAQVADGFVLESVTARSAVLGAGGGGEPILVLRLPTRPLAVMAPPKNGAALPAR